MVAVMYGCGLRRGEVVGLDLRDYQPGQSPEVVVRGGKGRKDRGLDLKPALKRRLDVWVEVRGLAPGPLFCPTNKMGQVFIGRLGAQTVTDVVREIARGSGVRPFTPHDLRRTFATHLRDAGEPIEIVAELMGHSSTAVTARYYRSNPKKLRDASLKLPGGEA
jgi:integrase